MFNRKLTSQLPKWSMQLLPQSFLGGSYRIFIYSVLLLSWLQNEALIQNRDIYLYVTLMPKMPSGIAERSPYSWRLFKKLTHTSSKLEANIWLTGQILWVDTRRLDRGESPHWGLHNTSVVKHASFVFSSWWLNNIPKEDFKHNHWILQCKKSISK